jgi:hypothetical protein
LDNFYPAFNEADKILDRRPISIVVPTYRETDETLFLCKYKLGVAFPNCEILFIENYAKIGWALKKGIVESKNELIFKTGADLPLGTSFIQWALDFADKFDFIYASKHVENAINNRPLSRRILSWAHTKYWGLYVKDISDFTCDKMYRKSTIEPLLNNTSDSNRFELDICRKVIKNHLRIKELPAFCNDRRNRGIVPFLKS